MKEPPKRVLRSTSDEPRAGLDLPRKNNRCLQPAPIQKPENALSQRPEFPVGREAFSIAFGVWPTVAPFMWIMDLYIGGKLG
jgi:hypothetical protein